MNYNMETYVWRQQLHYFSQHMLKTQVETNTQNYMNTTLSIGVNRFKMNYVEEWKGRMMLTDWHNEGALKGDSYKYKVFAVADPGITNGELRKEMVKLSST